MIDEVQELLAVGAEAHAAVRGIPGGEFHVERNAGAAVVLAAGAGEQIKASADSPSHEIVNRRASVADEASASVAGSLDWLAEIVTGVPASDVLLAEETPAST